MDFPLHIRGICAYWHSGQVVAPVRRSVDSSKTVGVPGLIPVLNLLPETGKDMIWPLGDLGRFGAAPVSRTSNAGAFGAGLSEPGGASLPILE